MGALRTRDGISIRFARWPPPAHRKGTLWIFEGRIEFIEKYFEIVRELDLYRGQFWAAFDAFLPGTPAF